MPTIRNYQAAPVPYGDCEESGHGGDLVAASIYKPVFGPDSAAVGQFLSDAAHGAAEAGHGVRVICGRSDYMACEAGNREGIRDGFSRTARPDGGKSSHGSIEVIRVGHLAFSHSRAKKLLSYATFYAGATWKALCGPGRTWC